GTKAMEQTTALHSRPHNPIQPGASADGMKRFLKRQKERIRSLFEDRSSHALYDNRGYIRP
ncbi:MAG: hypothetical protein K9M82_09970, partial [Deltaproteobacteria bacterium]|nr:hypothetical protein [Deltaproteobacteria bacterium]